MLKGELPPGTLVDNRYLIQQVLGQGGFGRTYKAYDRYRFDKACVLKEFIPNSTSIEIIQKSQSLFEREAKVLYQLKHPQIPEFLGWFREKGRLFIAQEYIDGKNYWILLQERQYFSEAEVIKLLFTLLPVLEHIHGQNIFHRDISPDNIMQPNDLQQLPVLIDFGAVKQTLTQIYTVGGSASVESTSFVGKLGYAPPEQMRVGQYFPNSDLYALAVTAIVFLTGKTPDLLFNNQNLKFEWESYASVSQQLTQVLNKMLADKPKDRYQSASEVILALRAIRISNYQGSTLNKQQSQTVGVSLKKQLLNSAVKAIPTIVLPSSSKAVKALSNTHSKPLVYILAVLATLLVFGVILQVLLSDNLYQKKRHTETNNTQVNPDKSSKQLPSCKVALFGECSP
jgi:serine/threonine protein kinase